MRLTDGGGLYLEVAPNRSRRWFWKYYFGGKAKRLALGHDTEAGSTKVVVSSPSDGLGGRPLEQPPARSPERGGAPRRLKGSLVPGCARP